MQCVCLFSGVKINQCALKLGSEGCVGFIKYEKRVEHSGNMSGSSEGLWHFKVFVSVW